MKRIISGLVSPLMFTLMAGSPAMLESRIRRMPDRFS